MQQPVNGSLQFIGIGAHRIERIVEKFIHHQQGAVADIGRPVVDACQQRTDELCVPRIFCMSLKGSLKYLCSHAFPPEVRVKFIVEDGKFFFRVKDRYVVDGYVVDLHGNNSKSK